MKASRSLIPGGWFFLWSKPPPSLTEVQLTASASAVHGSLFAVRFRNWLFIGGVLLLLAGQPAGGAEGALTTEVDDGAGLSAEEFSVAALVFHTKAAPSDDQLLRRMRTSAGLRRIFSLTRNYNPRSAGADDRCELLMAGAPRGLFLQFTLGDNGLVVFVAGAVGPHFEKLSTWSGQSGAGVIYPLNSGVGLFIDALTVTPYCNRCYGVARAGLRILF